MLKLKDLNAKKIKTIKSFSLLLMLGLMVSCNSLNPGSVELTGEEKSRAKHSKEVDKEFEQKIDQINQEAEPFPLNSNVKIHYKLNGQKKILIGKYHSLSLDQKRVTIGSKTLEVFFIEPSDRKRLIYHNKPATLRRLADEEIARIETQKEAEIERRVAADKAAGKF